MNVRWKMVILATFLCSAGGAAAEDAERKLPSLYAEVVLDVQGMT